jgi:uncharacterized protein (DUF697 family)
MRLKQAERIVTNHVVSSLGAGLIPVPLLDMAAVTAVQLDMIVKLSQNYDVPYDQGSTKAMIASLGTNTISRLGARMAIKMIPGVGSILGGASMAVFAAAGTYALGKVYIRHFEKGGTMLDLDAGQVKDYYDDQLEKGKGFVENIKSKKQDAEFSETDNTATNKNLMSQLENAADMKAKGLINDEEFIALKKRILGL